MNTKSKKSRNPGTINGTGNKKRTFGILAGLALAISLTILIFSGCDTSNDTVTNADVAAVNAAISKLDYTSITFADTEDQDTVRSDFTLPLSGERETAISWESSNTDIVSIDQASAIVGSLRTGKESIAISLTATVSKGSAKQSKDFSITVWANDNVTPGVPGGLRISQWAADSLYLEWEEALPGRVGGEAGTITGYTVYYSTSDDFLNLEELRSANQSIVLGPSTTTQVTGLESGTQYYITITASNDYGEGPVSPSLETHTNTPDDFVPDAPAIIGRSAGNGQVELTWTAPAETGWKDGQVIAISGYNIYQANSPITDITNTPGLMTVVTGIEPDTRTWEVSGLTNGTEYYFAVSALIGEDKETLPGGGDISVIPDENISTIRDVLSLSVEDFAALTGTSGQVISVDITDTNPSGLTYGTDYIISISKAGSSVEALVYNPDTQEIDLADTIGPADAGSYTIRASGMGQYNEAVTDDFELTVNPSDTSLLEQALKALSYADMRFAANEDQSSVYSDFTLPLTGLHGSSIDWKSDNPVVAISGSAAAVDPPDEGTVVTLTAELYLNAENASKEFIIVLTHPPNTLPGAPGNLAFTSWDTEAIGLSWSAEDSGYVDGSKASISAYTVYYSETGDFSDLTALKNAGQYVEVSAAADSEAETTAIVSGLTSGGLYSFAVSASNSTGEGPLSSSIETHTNSSPDAPVIIGRSAADQQIVLTWAAPAISGWTDGHENIISSYDIYQAASAISDLSGLDVLETVNNVNPAGLQSYTVTGLANGSDYYFAVAAVTASGRSLPGGGDVSVSPGTTTDLDTVITLSVEDAAASTNTPDQSIAVSLNDGGLSYGQDYSITIIKGGRATTALSWDATGTTITVSSALSESDGGDYSIIASGMGAYGGNVSDPFTLTVNLSDTDAVAAAQAALDISTEAGGDLNAVTVSQIALPIDGRYDTAISWASSDENVIRADGTVIIPAVGSQDAEVTLTATISKNTANAQKTFNLIVKAPVDVKNTFPGEPTDLALSAWTDTSIELNWTAPDPGYVGGVPGSIRSYRVYYSESDDFSNLTGLDSSTGVTSPLTISNLSSGTLYYFAVSASNANGEGPVSPSVSTRTNSAPGTPGISARIAGDGQVGLNWLAPALSGWTDGEAAVIEHYEIYQSDTPISAISGMTAVYTTANAAEKSYTLTSLNNGQDYYFAVVAVTAGGKSAPGGGDAAVRPSDAITGLDTTPFALSIDSASIYTNSPGQFISVTLNEGGLIYGQDYAISISKGGASTTLLAWNTTDGRIDVIETVTEVGADIWTVTASGMGTYSGIIEANFELEVLLSDAEAVAAAAAALDIGEAVGGDADAVRDGFTLPLNGIEGTAIAWQSTDTGIAIAPDGTVTVSRPAAGNADAPVTLQATISKNNEQEDKSFMLTIKAYPDTGNAADTAPGEPFGLRFNTWTENSIELSWSAPDAGKEGGNPGTISGYTVYYSSNNDFADLAALAGQSIDTASTTATVGGLTSGQQYYFAVTASNAHGESSVSQSKTTRTNAAPGTPLISARNAGDGQVEIVWAAARSAGWINGTAAAIKEYEIYQSNSAIADLTGQTAIHTSSALARTYTIGALTNGESYYFAVVTVSDINGRSAPGGGDIPVTPNDNLILLTSTQFSLSIDNAAALTNTAGQIIAVNLNEDNLVYGQDYGITVSKAGTATTEIAWNPANRQLDIVAVLSAAGTEHYTLTASGMGTYSGIIERSFELQISLSAADAVAAAKAALDIREAAGGDLDAVTVPQIALPLSGINGTDIEWTSNNPNVISSNGAVSRPAVGAFDAAVILKASIRKDGEEAEKSFTLTVKAQQPSGPSTVPDAIGSIVLSEWSETSVRLDWTEAHPGFIDGIQTSISAYTVYYNTSDDFSDLETLANRTVDAGTNLYAVIDGLESGKLYYFAVTASNTVGEGPVAQSVSTRTNSLPGRPLITERIPGNEEVQLSWLAPASAGWKDGAQASIVEYRIYQAVQTIDNVEQLSPVGSAQDMRYTASSLSNGQTYYFAVTAVNGHGEESLPAGGEVGISPTDIAPDSIKDDTSFLLSVEDAAAWTNTAGQTIDVDLDEDSLVYGQDYSIVISKAESEAPELYYDSGIGKIRVSDALAASLVGDTTYTVTAHGMGSYKDSVTDDFVLTVSLSDADVVAADKRTLDISQEAGGNLNAVVIEHINLPANGPNGSAITWSSSNSAVIADDGAVSRPSIGTADAVVELTASIRKNNASSTRKFTLTVLALTGIANTAPGAPEDLQATPGELKITLSWIAPKDRGSVRGQSASSLTYSVSGHETLDAAQSIPGIGSIRGTVVEVENLKANTEYSFYVRASNSGAQSTPATINATALDSSNLIEITAISYTPNNLELMAGQTIEAISPALTPDTVKPEDPRLSFAISPTDFEAQTGLDFDENTGRISGTASQTALVSYTISVSPDTGYYKGTPTAAMNIEVIPALTATWNPITATAFTPEAFGRPSLDSDKWTGSFIAASLPDGLDINPRTGEISGEPNGAYAADDYQIELRGRNDYFGVNSSASVNIRVNPKDLGETDFSITDLSHSVVALTDDTASLSIDNAGLTPTSDYTLSISPDANGNIHIDDTGTISIDAGITVSDARVYTITATGQNDYTATVTGTFTLTVTSKTLTSAMLGTISNPAADFEIQAGFANPITRTLSFDGSLTIEDDYTLAITGRPQGAEESHVSLDAATGVLTLSTAIVPDDSGDYTITVSAAGNYTDPATPLTTAFRLTVTKAGITSITYSPVTATFKTAMAQSASPTIVPADAAIGASFTISPDLNTNTGLSFDTTTGAISGTPTKRDTGKYTVTISGGDGTKYDGTALTSAEFDVIIDRKPIEGTLSYTGGSIGNIDTTYATAQALSVQWENELPDQSVTYAIAPTVSADPALPGDITFVESSGALSVSNLTAVHTGTYTITASGTGDYTGTKEAQVSIDVAPKALSQSDLGGISNSPFEVNTGGSSPFVETLSFDGQLVLGDDYSVSIKTRPTGADETRVTLTGTGVLTIADTVLLSEAGEYTVEAAGKGNYAGTAEATFTLNVQAAALTSISYGGQPLTAVYNTAITALTATVEPAAAADKVDFSIDPSLNSDTGLTFDTSSGRISGTPDKLLAQKAYTVTITGKTNTIYEGETKNVSIQVSVAQKDISDTAFAMTFDDKSDANEGAAASHPAASFNTGGLSAATDYELSITGPGGAAVPAVTIDNSGSISIGSDIDKSNTGLYSVKAAGINNYTGTIEETFTLTVRREITDISFTESTLSLMPNQTMTALTPTLKAGTVTQQNDDNISYSIDPDLNTNTGLTFDTATGTISGTATTESTSTTYTITVKPDAGHYISTATATVDIEVTEALSASYSNIDATVNTAITTAGATVNHAGWTGTFSATLPDDLKINVGSGEINGTPTSIATAATDYTVNLTGTGSYLGVNATATVTITVNPKLITSVTYAEVHAQATVEIAPLVAPTVLPDGANVEYALDPKSKALPSGLSVNPDSGAIEGTPEAGTNQDLTAYTILVSGTGDWLGSDIQATVNIKIDTAPEISASYDELSIRIRDTVDLTYNSITSGETATFTMASGESLPAGLTLESNGRITGTATSITGIKTYNIVLTGTGTSDGRSGTASVVITVEPKAITSVSYEDINAVYDTAITPVAPTKNPSGLTATYSSANLPTGLTVDSNGEISGQPTILQTTATESTITITGTGDWAGRSYDAKVNITIGPKALSDVSGFTISGSDGVTALTGGTVTATVDGGLEHTSDYTLSIDKGGSSVAAVTINNAGIITIDSTITVSDAGTYTITATGQGNYTGTKTGTFALTVGQKALVQSDLGSITNAQSDFEITAGSGSDITRTLNFNGALAGGIGTDYTVGITAPSGAVASRVSLNSNTGELTISADIVPDDSGTYTVTATGDGNYKDTASATFVLTVTAASVSISYSDTTLTASYGEGIPTLTPTITPSGADINYSISPNLKTNTGLDFDTDTGEISGTPSSLLSTTKYTVSITGTDGTKYDGATDSFEIDVTVEQRDIEGTLTYSDIDTTYGEVLAVTPQWSGGLADQTVTYTINPTPPSDIIFTTDTGALSVSNMTAVHTGIYTITAEGTGNYKGTKTFEVDVTVSAKTLSAASFSISGTKTVTALTGGSATATVAGGLTHTSDYTLSIDKGGSSVAAVTINHNGTITIGSGITINDAGDYTITATGQDNYSGTVTGTFTLTVNPKDLSSTLLGTINNSPTDFDVSAGITSDHTKTLSFTGSLTIDEDYTLAITTRPQDATDSHVSLNSTTGLLTVTTDVVPDDAGDYTVTATGKNNYGSTTTASFTLSITPLAINTITYSSDVTAVYNTAMAAVAPTVDPSDAAATYSITPNLNAETGLDFSTATGEISGTPNKILLSSKNYTVTIAGADGTKYEGSSKTATVNVTVNRKSLADVSGFSVSAANHSTTAKTSGSHSASITSGGLTPGSDYTLSIDKGGNPVAAVTIDNDGNISIDAGITVSDTGNYTITATGQGNYSGTITGTFTLTVDAIPLTSTLLGSINNPAADFTVSAGITSEHTTTLSFTGSLTINEDYTLSITDRPTDATDSHVSLNSSTGVLTVTTDVVPDDAGVYTVTASGQGKYTDPVNPVTATFTLTVTKLDITSVTYTSVTAVYDTVMAAAVAPTVDPADAAVSYSIDPNLHDDTGLDFNTATGVISGTPTSALSSKDYTVTIAGADSTKYEGSSKTATVNVTVNPKSLTDVSGFSVSVANHDTTAKTGGSHSATVNKDGLTPGSDYTLSIAKGGNTVTAVTIEDDGTITIGSGITFSDAGTYTITATGQGNYSGTKAADFEITVNKINISGTFSYADLEITDGQNKKSNASWNNAASGQTVSYTLVNSPAGISIDGNNGVVTVNASVVTADTTLTIRAEGTGSYTGEITAVLRIFIREWIPSSVTLTYSDIRVFKGNFLSRSARWSSGSYDVEYSMVPINGGTLPDGISIDSSSGEITVGSSAAAQADTLYKVTAAGINSWKGWKKADIRISVIDSFYYEFKPALVGQAFTLTPQNVTSAQFAPDPSLPPGLTLNSGSGVISGTPTTRQLATEYTITATPTGGGTAISNKVYLFIQQQASDKTHLWQMIDEEITAQGSNANLNLIDTSLITDMEKLFDSVSQGHHANYSSFNGDLSGWDVSRVTKMNSMFYGASAFNGDISEWNVSGVTDMKDMFRKANSFNGDISSWNVSSVTSMHSMFSEATAFNGDLSKWNVTDVTTMNSMFYDASSFNGDISKWNVSNVQSMNSMFSKAAAFNGDLSEWTTTELSSMISIFAGASSFNGDISEWDVDRVHNMSYIFNEAESFNGDISEWDVAKVTNMNRMFYGASSFNGDISGWTVNTGADMNEMFVGSGLENSPPAWYSP